MPTRLLLGFMVALALGVAGGTLAVRAANPKPARASMAPTMSVAGKPPVIRPRDVSSDSGRGAPVSPAARVDTQHAITKAIAANIAAVPKRDSAATIATAPPADSVADSAQAAAVEAAHARVSKMFGTMQARDAARVLGQMPDDEVISILSGLRERQAGSIVAELDAKRAAEIGRALLRVRGGSR